MAPLIKRPNSAVSRPVVEAVLRRLMQQPTEVRLRIAMRAVDEYAATLHTDRVYAHAQKIVDRALIEAAEVRRAGDEFLPESEIKNLPVTNFCGNCGVEKFFNQKKFFKWGSAEKGVKIIPAQGTSPSFPTCHDCPGCPNCPTPMVRAQMECHTSPVTRDIAPYMEQPDTNDPCAKDQDTNPVGGEPLKICSLCGTFLPLDSFTRNRARPDGHASACRACEIKRKALRRAAKRDRAPHP